MDPLLNPRFHSIYALVITSAVYLGTYFASFYWPSFIGYILFPDQIEQIETIAGVLVLPLGLIFLGVRSGARVIGLHLLIAIIAIGISVTAALALGRGGEPAFVRNIVMISMLGGYFLAACLSLKRKLFKTMSQSTTPQATINN